MTYVIPEKSSTESCSNLTHPETDSAEEGAPGEEEGDRVASATGKTGKFTSFWILYWYCKRISQTCLDVNENVFFWCITFYAWIRNIECLKFVTYAVFL